MNCLTSLTSLSALSTESQMPKPLLASLKGQPRLCVVVRSSFPKPHSKWEPGDNLNSCFGAQSPGS